jgi:uncharacterized membrane protein
MPGPLRRERREPIVLALLVAIAIPLLMPVHFLPSDGWIVSIVLGVLLLALLIIDPGHIDNRSIRAHQLRLAIVIVLISSAGFATVILTRDLIFGSTAITNSAPELLRASALVFVAVVISFAFLYWELDLGGPGERAHNERKYPDLAFPEELSPEVCPPGWRPVFVDYLYLAVTNGVAFSPTDVMPLAHWAKLAMGIQSIASLALIGLVVARAVNIFH